METSYVFSVRSAYKVQASHPIEAFTVSVTTLWNKHVPLKVVLFAWRLFRDRLPTKDNLLRRGVIPYDSRLCIAGCNTVETSTHLFLHCPMFGTVWYLLFRWLGFSTAIPLGVVDHFNQFFLDGGNVKARGAILHAIWFATTWEIWKERNNRLFNGKHSSIFNVVDKIKSLAFMWLQFMWLQKLQTTWNLW